MKVRLAIIVLAALSATLPLATAQKTSGPAAAPAVKAMTGPQVLARVQEVYSQLKTYSDSGTIVTEDGLPGTSTITKETHSFTTRFTGPRQFKFDFRKDGGDRYVIWGEGESFFTWWKSTGVTEEYPRGEGATAFAVSTLPTVGGALVISPLLFPTAGLQGPLSAFDAPKFLAIEDLGGRKMYKIRGDVRLNHWGTGVRPTTVWVDAQTFLIRRIVEDTATNSSVKGVTTTTLTPVANPAIPAAEYKFTPPSQ